MFYEGGAWMGGMHWFWWIFWLALVGSIVFYGWGRKGPSASQPPETPHQLLQRRLASGEVTRDEYEQRKALLDRDAGARV